MFKRNLGLNPLVCWRGVLLGLSAGSAVAGMPPPPNTCGAFNSTVCAAPTMQTTQTAGQHHKDTTQAFAGINWSFGEGPELVVGVRSLRVNQRQRVVGARLEATFPFDASAISFDKVRLRLVDGHRKGMYELGGGYSFAGQGFLLSGALQGGHVAVGTDFTLNTSQWQPFVGIDSLDRAKAPQGPQSTTTMACAPGAGTPTPVGTVQSSNGGMPVPAGVQLSGYTCYR